MLVDCHGDEVTGASPQALAHYAGAVEQFALYVGDPVASLAEATLDSPTFALAHLANGASPSRGHRHGRGAGR